VVGTEASAGGIRLDRLSCDSCGSIIAVATPREGDSGCIQVVRCTVCYQRANRRRQGH
jgi:hypothetical protein